MCEKCGQEHLTANGLPACPGHITNGERKGEPCRHELGWGTNHTSVGCCKMHGGNTETHNKNAQMELARRECDRLGIAVEVDPTEALLHEVWETAGNVEFYRTLVQQLQTHPDDDEITGFKEDGTPIFERGAAGIYGKTYHLSGIPTGEAKPHILVQMYNNERKHLLDVTSAAIRLGIEERRVNLEENRATEVFRAVTQALTAMGMADQFDTFRAHFANALAAGRPVSVGIGAAR